MNEIDGGEGTKFCKDCKFSKREFFFGMKFAKCLHPESIKKNVDDYLVAGKSTGESCSSMRGTFGACGAPGLLFQFKNERKRKIHEVITALDRR
jgi:hypothetical protein